MKRVITVTVINKSGVLNRVTGLFAKRQFNIESITVGHTEQSEISKMTFIVNVEDERKWNSLSNSFKNKLMC